MVTLRNFRSKQNGIGVGLQGVAGSDAMVAQWLRRLL